MKQKLFEANVIEALSLLFLLQQHMPLSAVLLPSRQLLKPTVLQRKFIFCKNSVAAIYQIRVCHIPLPSLFSTSSPCPKRLLTMNKSHKYPDECSLIHESTNLSTRSSSLLRLIGSHELHRSNEKFQRSQVTCLASKTTSQYRFRVHI